MHGSLIILLELWTTIRDEIKVNKSLNLWCFDAWKSCIWTVEWNEVWSVWSSQFFNATNEESLKNSGVNGIWPWPLRCQCSSDLPVELSGQLGAGCYVGQLQARRWWVLIYIYIYIYIYQLSLLWVSRLLAIFRLPEDRQQAWNSE